MRTQDTSDGFWPKSFAISVTALCQHGERAQPPWQRRTAQGDGEEVKSIPCPSSKTNPEHCPLMAIERTDDFPWVLKLLLRGLQRRESSREVMEYLSG